MFAIVAEFKVKPGKKQPFMEALLEDARGASLNEPGCTQFSVVEDEADSLTIYLYEQYKERKDYEYHRTTPYYLKWRQTAKEYFASDPIIKRGLILYPK